MKVVKTAAEPARRVDPVGELCAILTEPGENEAKVAARKTVGAMTQRPWEQLPSAIKSAIRADFAGMLNASKSRDDMLAAGYSAVIVERALRDLGWKRS